MHNGHEHTYTHMTFALIGMHLITISIEYPLDVTLSLPIIGIFSYSSIYLGGGRSWPPPHRTRLSNILLNSEETESDNEILCNVQWCFWCCSYILNKEGSKRSLSIHPANRDALKEIPKVKVDEVQYNAMSWPSQDLFTCKKTWDGRVQG